MKTIVLLFILCVGVTAQAQKSQPVKDCTPTLTTSTIRGFLYGKTIKEVSSADASGEPTEWTFEKRELIEIDVIETTREENKVTSVVSIRTGDAPGRVRLLDNKGKLDSAFLIAGRLRLSFELIAGEWTLLKIENLSVKYSELQPEVIKPEN